MPHYKDTQNKIYFLSDEDVINGWENNLPSNCIKISDEEALIAQQPTKQQRLAILAAEYNADLTAMKNAWLSAAVAGGPTEADKKAVIEQDIADRKVQYLADMTVIKNS